MTLDAAELAKIHKLIDDLRKEGDKGKEEIHKGIKDAYRYYMEYNISRQTDPDNTDMQYKANYLYTRYAEMKDYAAKKETE